MGNVVTDDAIVVEEAQIVRMADIDDATPAVRKTDRLYPPRIDPLSALTVSERLQRLEERLEWVVEVEPPGADAAMALADLLPSAVEGDRVLALRPSDPRWLGVFRAVSALKTYARAFLERRRMPGADDDAPAQFQLLRALYRLGVNSATAVAAAAANPPCALVSVAALRLLHEALVCVPSTDDAADEKTPWSALRPAIAGALMLLRWVLLRPALPNGADQEWQAEAQALTVRLACQYLQRLRVAPDAVSATVMEELLLILLLTLHASYAHRAPIRLWVLTERPAALVSALLHALSHTTRLAATPEVHSPDSSDVISRAEVYMYTEHKALDLLITRRPLGAQAANRHDVASSSHRWAEAMKGDAAAAAAASRPRSWSSLLIYLLPFGRSSASRSTEEGSEKDAWQRWTREYTRLSDAEREFLRLLAEPLSDVPESPRETTLADAGATAAVDVKEAATSRTLPCLTMIVLLALLVTPAPVAEVDAATDARKHAPRAHYPFLAALTALTDASRTRRAAPSGDALRSNPLAGGYGEPAGARCALNALFEALACWLQEREGAHLLYHLLQERGCSWRVYVAARSDPESIVLPLLHRLYDTARVGGAYLPISCLAMLVEDDGWCDAVAHKRLERSVEWFRERRLEAERTTLADLMLCVLVRLVRRCRGDAYLRTMALAVLSGLALPMGRASRPIPVDPYVPGRLVALFDLLWRRRAPAGNVVDSTDDGARRRYLGTVLEVLFHMLVAAEFDEHKCGPLLFELFNRREALQRALLETGRADSPLDAALQLLMQRYARLQGARQRYNTLSVFLPADTAQESLVTQVAASADAAEPSVDQVEHMIRQTARHMRRALACPTGAPRLPLSCGRKRPAHLARAHRVDNGRITRRIAVVVEDIRASPCRPITHRCRHAPLPIFSLYSSVPDVSDHVVRPYHDPHPHTHSHPLSIHPFPTSPTTSSDHTMTHTRPCTPVAPSQHRPTSDRRATRSDCGGRRSVGVCGAARTR
ncbi:hypothetical protein CDCA_CDCA04G1222 [Cyanidium caldarium]|uniref:Dymeclin n=1 Tax=Cyanidium caldarium TaxID=2771 RepID=A0AAV9IS79_CYACA|nr:hypothetical protein CDCA_CDCA04G1222 [Cyanidium caldarium]